MCVPSNGASESDGDSTKSSTASLSSSVMVASGPFKVNLRCKIDRQLHRLQAAPLSRHIILSAHVDDGIGGAFTQAVLDWMYEQIIARGFSFSQCGPWKTVLGDTRHCSRNWHEALLAHAGIACENFWHKALLAHEALLEACGIAQALRTLRSRHETSLVKTFGTRHCSRDWKLRTRHCS